MKSFFQRHFLCLCTALTLVSAPAEVFSGNIIAFSNVILQIE